MFLDKKVTEDDTWVYSYEPESKRRSSEWKKPGSPRPKKAKRTWSQKKVMLITFFDSKDLIHYKFLENGQTVNSSFYIEVLRRFREKLCKKRPDMWQSGDWILQHDGASSHSSMLTRGHMEKNKFDVLPHPSYSPDLAPCDFYLSNTKEKSVRDQICYHQGDQRSIGSCPEPAASRELPAGLPQPSASLGQSYKLGRSIFRG